MKIVYVNTDTFDVSMTEKEGFQPFQTSLFDYMSDKDIEAQFYIPMGYSYTDPDSGERWSGEFIRNKEGMPTLSNLADIRNKAMNAANAADEAKEVADEAKESIELNTVTLDDVMAALVELGDMVAALAEQPVSDTEVTDENIENTPVSEDGTAVAEEVIQNG